jgi:HKD family nuclease
VKAKFLTGVDIERALSRLMKEHDQFHWAVAWGGGTVLAKELIAQSDKIRQVVFGIAFSQTDPDLIDKLVGRRNCYVATKFKGGTFHPKVYCFQSGDRVAAIIGSANFTRGGMGPNLEAAVELTGAATDAALKDALDFVKGSVAHAEKVTAELAKRYRMSCKLAARKPKPPRDPLAALASLSEGALSSPLLAMSWDEYVSAVRSSSQHPVDDSLGLLRVAQKWLASARSFGDLTAPQRKAIAGTLGEYQKTDAELARDWGWFGSMRGAGDFANRVEENDRHLARALDGIPGKGAVSRAHYDRFAEEFVKAFANSSRTGGVRTASRLLAMKRPDNFLCVSQPNLTLASGQLGFAKSTLDLANYWDKVVEPIRASEWWSADKPRGSTGDLWEGRAAMLDAIFYRPA